MTETRRTLGGLASVLAFGGLMLGAMQVHAASCYKRTYGSAGGTQAQCNTADGVVGITAIQSALGDNGRTYKIATVGGDDETGCYGKARYGWWLPTGGGGTHYSTIQTQPTYGSTVYAQKAHTVQGIGDFQWVEVHCQ